MRQYVSHNDERIYLDETPVQVEYMCTQCGNEIFPASVCYLSGVAEKPGGWTVPLGSWQENPLHAGCISDFVARELAGRS